MGDKYYVMNKKSDDEGNISIFGDIGDSWWSEGVTAKDFKKDLESLGNVKVLNIDINSPGGSFFEGLAIYNMLKNHTATKKMVVLGLAASAASTIAMAGDEISMSEDAYIMIHNARMMAGGDKNDMLKASEELSKFDKTIANIYAKKTGKTEEELLNLMADETWMNGKDAMDMGFIDKLTEAKKAAAHFDPKQFKNTPNKLIQAGRVVSTAGSIIDMYHEELSLIKRRVL